MISIFGVSLAGGVAEAESLPLPIELGDVVVSIAGRPAPLLFVSPGQINAVVPEGIEINTNHQILVQRGVTYAQPVSAAMAASQPAVFLAPQIRQDQAIAVDAAFRLATPDTPINRGDAVIFFCSGLGDVDRPYGAAEAPPVDALARTTEPPTVTIGGAEAQVLFAGGAPGFAGLYQINAIVPEGSQIGDNIPVEIEIGGQSSPTAIIAVR